MIGLAIRVLLIIGCLSTLIFILTKVRKAQMQIEDTIFWIFFAALLLFMSLFPQLLYWLSALLGFMAPINLVYLLIIFLLLIHEFSMTVRISQMDVKLRTLTQRVALNQKKIEEEQAPSSDQPQ